MLILLPPLFFLNSGRKKPPPFSGLEKSPRSALLPLGGKEEVVAPLQRSSHHTGNSPSLFRSTRGFGNAFFLLSPASLFWRGMRSLLRPSHTDPLSLKHWSPPLLAVQDSRFVAFLFFSFLVGGPFNPEVPCLLFWLRFFFFSSEIGASSALHFFSCRLTYLPPSSHESDGKCLLSPRVFTLFSAPLSRGGERAVSPPTPDFVPRFRPLLLPAIRSKRKDSLKLPLQGRFFESFVPSSFQRKPASRPFYKKGHRASRTLRA